MARFPLGPRWRLEFGNLLNFPAPEEYDIAREGEIIGASAVTDVIVENGQAEFRRSYIAHIHTFIRRGIHIMYNIEYVYSVYIYIMWYIVYIELYIV